MNIVITGASGFIGRAILQAAVAKGWSVRAVVHRQDVPHSDVHRVDDLTDVKAWNKVLAGADAVVHLAARVHAPRERADAAYVRVNTDGTAALAQAAAAAGVRRFVYFSSIGVHGPSDGGVPIVESSPIRPVNAYARSKWQAEQRLTEIARGTSLECVIVRPPLVYGPAAPGNFMTLWRCVEQGVPLPLASIRNARSLIGVDNLVDFSLHALTHPAAANETFVLADGEDVSMPELVRRMGRAMGRAPRLLPLPVALIRLAARCLPLPEAYRHLIDSLRVDARKARQQLAWTPPLTLDAELARVAAWNAARKTA